jgi:hypothetical protein
VVLFPGTVLGEASWLPQRIDARYAVKAEALGGRVVGETRWRVDRPEPGVLVYESVMEPSVFFLSETRQKSVIDVVGEQLRPRRYDYNKRNRHDSVVFNWQSGRVTSKKKGRPYDLALAPNTLDKLSYLLAAMRDLAAGKRELSYAVASGDVVEEYRLQVTGKSLVKTGRGNYQALEVKRLGQKKRQTTIWFAPALKYLPVKVLHVEKDGWVELLFDGADGMKAKKRRARPAQPTGDAEGP